MEVIGYVAAAVVAFLVGWFLSRPKKAPRRIDVTITNKNGELEKEMYPKQSEAIVGDKVVWNIINDSTVAVTVSIDNFKVTPEGSSASVTKVPFIIAPIPKAFLPKEKGKMEADIQPKDMLKNPPPAHRHDADTILFQDFTYELKLNGKLFDPEIRIRET